MQAHSILRGLPSVILMCSISSRGYDYHFYYRKRLHRHGHDLCLQQVNPEVLTLSQVRWRQEEKTKEEAVARADKEKRAKEQAEAAFKRREEATRRKAEQDKQRLRDDVDRLTQELSTLRAAESAHFVTASWDSPATTVPMNGGGKLGLKEPERHSWYNNYVRTVFAGLLLFLVCQIMSSLEIANHEWSPWPSARSFSFVHFMCFFGIILVCFVCVFFYFLCSEGSLLCAGMSGGIASVWCACARKCWWSFYRVLTRWCASNATSFMRKRACGIVLLVEHLFSNAFASMVLAASALSLESIAINET